VSVAEEGLSTRKDTDEAMTATVRELAQRRSGTDEILLLWRPEIDRVDSSFGTLQPGRASS
jgi:hypothetical protein